MSVIQIPYHLDEYLPDLDVPLPPDTVITADLPAGDVWDRLSALYAGLAGAVAGEARRGGRPVVVSGDCTTALGTMSGLQQAGIEAGIVWFDAHGLRLPVPGGPSPAQVTGALNALLGTGRVAAIGIACTWYPGHSAAAAIRQHLHTALA